MGMGRDGCAAAVPAASTKQLMANMRRDTHSTSTISDWTDVFVRGVKKYARTSDGDQLAGGVSMTPGGTFFLNITPPSRPPIVEKIAPRKHQTISDTAFARMR